MLAIVLEIGFGVVVCVVMAWVADVDNHSPLAWAGVTLFLCLASLAIPIPILRFFLAGLVTVVVMFVYNLVQLTRRRIS
jgi:hypothetical protein